MIDTNKEYTFNDLKVDIVRIKSNEEIKEEYEEAIEGVVGNDMVNEFEPEEWEGGGCIEFFAGKNTPNVAYYKWSWTKFNELTTVVTPFTKHKEKLKV